MYSIVGCCWVYWKVWILICDEKFIVVLRIKKKNMFKFLIIIVIKNKREREGVREGGRYSCREWVFIVFCE